MNPIKRAEELGWNYKSKSRKLDTMYKKHIVRFELLEQGLFQREVAELTGINERSVLVNTVKQYHALSETEPRFRKLIEVFNG